MSRYIEMAHRSFVEKTVIDLTSAKVVAVALKTGSTIPARHPVSAPPAFTPKTV